MRRRRESKGRGVSRCTCRATDCVPVAANLTLIIQLMTLPPTTALLLCMCLCVEVCMLHRCVSVFMHIWNV